MALTRSQYNQIMSVYQERRISNSLKQEARLREVYEKCPEIKALDDKARLLGVENAKDVISGRAENADGYKKELKALAEKKKKLMISAGFPDDYLDMAFDCMYCKDTGYIGNKKCRCFKKMQMRFLYAQSGLKDILKKENFSSFDEKLFDNEKELPRLKMTNREYMLAVEEECRRFADNFGRSEKKGVLFTGPTGTGKTFLANCISKKALDSGHSVIYMTATELFELLARARFKDENETLSDSRDMVFDCELLTIDDLGTELQTDFTVSQLFSLINYRMLHRRATVISTNLSMQSIRDIYTDRIASRVMRDYIVIPFYGKDLRLQGGKNDR